MHVLVGTGTADWDTYSGETIVPSGAETISCNLWGGFGTPEKEGITWFDDLKIYQDGELIYENYFTQIRLGKVVPVMITPPEIIVGAVQRFKAGRTGEEVIRAPMAPIL